MPTEDLTIISQWYAVISERERHCILSTLCESDRRLSFRDDCAVDYDQLPQYAKDFVIDEWHLLHPPTSK